MSFETDLSLVALKTTVQNHNFEKLTENKYYRHFQNINYGRDSNAVYFLSSSSTSSASLSFFVIFCSGKKQIKLAILFCCCETQKIRS